MVFNLYQLVKLMSQFLRLIISFNQHGPVSVVLP
jgi:hypothetical protein